MKHLDLFSGIGGFALAARWANMETVAFCEIDPFCQKVLAKNFPNVPIHNDIKTLNGEYFAGIDVITGGFPCQPFSQANSQKRKGKLDDRYLWPEMRRIIAQAKPRYIVVENSTDLEKFALEDVLLDLDTEGYDAAPVEIPAAGVGANHLRYRVWVIAHARSFNAGERRQRPAQREKVTRCTWWDAYPGVHRVDDGLPRRMDGRKKMLGNAIVPQVAYEILRAISAT